MRTGFTSLASKHHRGSLVIWRERCNLEPELLARSYIDRSTSAKSGGDCSSAGCRCLGKCLCSLLMKKHEVSQHSGLSKFVLGAGSLTIDLEPISEHGREFEILCKGR